MRRRHACAIAAGAVAAVALFADAARANPRVLPFTYTTDTLAPGAVEVEQYADLIPLVGTNPTTGARNYFLASEFFTELEIGLADRLELGLYFVEVPAINPEMLAQTPTLDEGNGLKQRIRYTFADPGEWPIDVGAYAELAESTYEVEIETKLLLQRRFGRLRVASNLWTEYEFYFSHQRDFVINPTLGASYEVSSKLHLGIDSWMRGEYPQNPAPATRSFALGPEAYVGPAIMMSFGKLWWSFAVYARVTDIDHSLVVGANEVYGPLWVRSMIGYNL